MSHINYAIEEGIVSRNNQDGTIILMKMDEGSTFFKINGVAAEVWKELSEKKNLNQIKEKILMNYNSTEVKVNEDVENFIDSLVKKNLIKKI